VDETENDHDQAVVHAASGKGFSWYIPIQ